MLDLETWGTSPYSTIISIGACVFNPYTEQQDKIITDRFEVAIAPTNTGLRVDAETLMWWMDRERDEARREWWHMPKVTTLVALDGFSGWLHELPQIIVQGLQITNVRIWGNGAGFDNVLLRQAYEIASRDTPWSFRHDRCFRTLRSMLTIEEGQYLGTLHTALADAENQAIRANQIVRKLGIKLT
jgi:exodeoxyribonuclease VIII